MENKKEPEIVYSRTVKAGKRIYYLDVKKARNEDLYVCITESKRMQGAPDQQPSFEKHKLFLYKEDFKHFSEGLEDVIGYIRQQFGDIEERPLLAPAEQNSVSDVEESELAVSPDDVSSEASVATVGNASDEEGVATVGNVSDEEGVASPEKRRFKLFGRNK